MSGSVADVADARQIDLVFDELRASLGGLDVLVNNAGIAGPTAAVEDISPDDWSRTMAVNITGQFLCARRAVPFLKAAGGGSIINMSSVAGRLGYIPLRTPATASKWAVIGFTESLAIQETGPRNIRVNALLPGIVEGERIRRVIAAGRGNLGVSRRNGRPVRTGLASPHGHARRRGGDGPVPLLSSRLQYQRTISERVRQCRSLALRCLWRSTRAEPRRVVAVQ